MNKKTISIDLWGTLVKSSPLFRNAKNELVKQYFSDLTDEDIENDFKKTKKQLNDIIVATGWQPELEIIYNLLYSNLSNNKLAYNKQLNFETEYQLLSLQYPSLIYSDKTLLYLKKFSTQFNVILSCNTMFLTGDTIKMLLKKIGIFEYFNDFKFSNELKCAKPNKLLYGDSDYHIGNYYKTDFEAPTDYRIKSILINGKYPDDIETAYNFIITDLTKY